MPILGFRGVFKKKDQLMFLQLFMMSFTSSDDESSTYLMALAVKVGAFSSPHCKICATLSHSSIPSAYKYWICKKNYYVNLSLICEQVSTTAKSSCNCWIFSGDIISAILITISSIICPCSICYYTYSHSVFICISLQVKCYHASVFSHAFEEALKYNNNNVYKSGHEKHFTFTL